MRSYSKDPFHQNTKVHKFNSQVNNAIRAYKRGQKLNNKRGSQSSKSKNSFNSNSLINSQNQSGLPKGCLIIFFIGIFILTILVCYWLDL